LKAATSESTANKARLVAAAILGNRTMLSPKGSHQTRDLVSCRLFS
jgi:hypothetical protein